MNPSPLRGTTPMVQHLGDELRNPIYDVINRVSIVSTKIEQSQLAEKDQVLPDLGKIDKAAHQLLRLVDDVFRNRVTADGQIDVDSFSATIRHDLRTPVNAIIGYSEMLFEDAQLIPEQSHFASEFQEILAIGNRLLTSINELIYFVKEREKPKPSKADLIEAAPHLLEDVFQTIAPEQALPEIPKATEATEVTEGTLLVVDDRDSNRELLSRQLGRSGFTVETAENGRQALEMMKAKPYDTILLDVLMPELNGYQVLAAIQADPELKHIPVIMISALDEIDSVVRCIEMGAQDYLQKPFNPTILKAKINATLERKRLRDREQAYVSRLKKEQEKSEKLLLNILPRPIAERLKRGERTIADSFHEVTVLFADLVNFTQMSAKIPPNELIERLNEIFLAFDILAELYGLEKIKTIGDSYMLVGGLPTERKDHAEAVAEMAIDMFDAISRLNEQNDTHLNIRVGIHTGPVIAGVIGKHKFNYDLWGDAVNIASRMESHSVPGMIQVSAATHARLQDKFELEERGVIDIKGKGPMLTYMLKHHFSK